MALLIREHSKEPYRLASYLNPQKRTPWKEADLMIGILLFALFILWVLFVETDPGFLAAALVTPQNQFEEEARGRMEFTEREKWVITLGTLFLTIAAIVGAFYLAI